MEYTTAYRFRIYPTKAQQRILDQTFEATRFVYNWALRKRIDSFYINNQRLSYVQTSAALTELKKQKGSEWLWDVSSVPTQQALRHLESAYRNFFAGTGKYPVFHKSSGKQTAEYTNSGFKISGHQLWIAKIEKPIKVRWSRELPSGAVVKTVTISKDASGRYFASMRFKTTKDLLSPSTTSIGVDLGIDSLATLSTGEKIANPRHSNQERKRLALAQRRLSRKTPGSSRYEKQRRRVAKTYAQISDRRQDHLHKLTTRLIQENQTIVVESLAVKNMMKNHKLAKHIADASWGELCRQLQYKSDQAGRELIEIDRWYPSSKRCSSCGYVVDTLPLSIRRWTCPDCGVDHDRDVNAAKNILAVGQTVDARGESVRPKRERVEATLDEARIPMGMSNQQSS